MFFLDIEEVTHKTGNFKQFSVFTSMLESAILQVCMHVEIYLRGGAGRQNCFAHFSTRSFHCTFIMISMKKYGERKQNNFFSRASFPWKWWPSLILGHSPRYI